jgi:transposase
MRVQVTKTANRFEISPLLVKILLKNGGFSHRRVADHFRVNHSIIVRLMQRFRQKGNVTDRPRAGRPRKTMPREDRLIFRRARQRPFSTAGALRGNLAFGGS